MSSVSKGETRGLDEKSKVLLMQHFGFLICSFIVEVFSFFKKNIYQLHYMAEFIGLLRKEWLFSIKCQSKVRAHTINFCFFKFLYYTVILQETLTDVTYSRDGIYGSHLNPHPGSTSERALPFKELAHF